MGKKRKNIYDGINVSKKAADIIVSVLSLTLIVLIIVALIGA